MRELSALDITENLQSDKHFKGVYDKNGLPKLEDDSFYIQNLENIQEGGSHWVLISTMKPGQVWYIDPVGEPLGTKRAEWRMKRTGRKIMRWNKEIQGVQSDSCGEYCCAFARLLSLRSKVSPQVILSQVFKKKGRNSYSKNEQTLRRLFSAFGWR